MRTCLLAWLLAACLACLCSPTTTGADDPPHAGNAPKDQPSGPDAGPTAPSKPPAKQTPARPPNLHQLLREIAQEGQNAVKQDWQWPTHSPAADKLRQAGLDRRTILRQLASGRLHAHPAVDAYVRFHLLACLPEQRLERSEVGPLLRSLPRYWPYPGIGPANESALMRLSNRVISDRQRSAVEKILGRISEAQNTFDHANAPVNAYFNLLAQRLPSDPALSLLLLIEQLDRQFQAGNPQAYTLMRAFQQNLLAVAEDKKISPAVKQSLIARLKGLTRSQRTVVAGARYDNENRLRVTVRPLGLTESAYAHYADLLAGRVKLQHR